MSRAALAVVLGAVVIVGGAACDDDDDGNGEAEVRTTVTTYLQGDKQYILDHSTDDGLVAVFGVGRAEAEQAPAEQFQLPPVTLTDTVDIDGDDASIEFEDQSDGIRNNGLISLVREDDVWKVDRLGLGDLDDPDGAITVDVDLNEFAFVFDEGDFESGKPVVIQSENVGDQPHFLQLVRLAESAPSLDELLQAPDQPEGVEDVAFIPTQQPDESESAVLDQPLTPGRYALLCFIADENDPQGTPHAFKGMAQEFRVE